MVLKSLIPVDSSSFGMKQPSDVRSVLDIRLRFQRLIMIFQSIDVSLRQFLYTLYVIPLGPGAEPARTLLMMFVTSLREGRFPMNSIFGGSGVIIFSLFSSGLCLSGSE